MREVPRQKGHLDPVTALIALGVNVGGHFVPERFQPRYQLAAKIAVAAASGLVTLWFVAKMAHWIH